jgi:hypothetical protein
VRQRIIGFFKLLEGFVFAVLGLLSTLAIGGAVMALVGAIFGLGSMKIIGGATAGFGAAGFFVWMLTASKFVGAFRAVPPVDDHRNTPPV